MRWCSVLLDVSDCQMNLPSQVNSWFSTLGSPGHMHGQRLGMAGVTVPPPQCRHSVPGNNMPAVGGQWTQKPESVHENAKGATWSGGTSAWNHMSPRPFLWRPELPVSMPWASGSQGLVSFTGGTVPAAFHTGDPDRGVKCKRRLVKEEQEEAEPCSKHFLSEEMMAAQFHCLSLNNDHMYGSNGFPVQSGGAGGDRSRWQQWLNDYNHFQELEGRLCLEEEDEDVGVKSDGKKNVIVEGVFDMSDSPVISVSSALQEGLKNLSGSILPEKVLRSMGHPCMEMVLWKPPGSIIRETIHSLTSQQDTTLPSQTQRDAATKEDAMATETLAHCSLPSFPLDYSSSKRRSVLLDCEDEMEL